MCKALGLLVNVLESQCKWISCTFEYNQLDMCWYKSGEGVLAQWMGFALEGLVFNVPVNMSHSSFATKDERCNEDHHVLASWSFY